jgi:hypothetical protein
MTDRDRRHAVLVRDAALARVGRVRRWVIAGTAALTAGAAALVSAVAPGRSLGAKPAAPTHTPSASAPSAPAVPAGTATAPKMPPLADPGSLGLAAPSEPPQASVPPDQNAQGAPSASAPSGPGQSQAGPAPAPAASQPSAVSGGS